MSSPPRVETYKRRRSRPRRRGRPPKYAWDTVDWSRRNKDIAASLGCDVNQVAHSRRRYAPETIGMKRPSRLAMSIAHSLQAEGIPITPERVQEHIIASASLRTLSDEDPEGH